VRKKKKKKLCREITPGKRKKEKLKREKKTKSRGLSVRRTGRGPFGKKGGNFKQKLDTATGP